jgi:hypothetical protein
MVVTLEPGGPIERVAGRARSIRVLVAKEELAAAQAPRVDHIRKCIDVTPR